MEDETLEDRSVEVLQIPDSLDDDLLWLYFENRRRSGGGNIISLIRTGDRAVLVFESVEVATRVLQKGSHRLSDAQLIIRKKPPKDHGKLVLRGLSPSTSRDLLELYVDNLTGIESDNYTLFQSPGKDLVLIHLHQPAAEDYEKMCSKVSKRALDGARLTLEQVECTDSIMVGNLTPELNDDLLTLYFESIRSGGGEVVGVSRISQHLAKVSFKDVQSVNVILQKSHRLEETDLTVEPYYSFLHSEDDSPQTGLQNGTDQGVDDQISTVSPVNGTHSDLISAASSSLSSSLSQEAMIVDLQVTPEPVDIPQVLQPPAKPQRSICHVSIPDPVKRELLTLCDIPEKLRTSHPGYEIRVTQNSVEVEGPAQDGAEKLKGEVLEFLSGMSQVHVTVSALKADFLRRQDVRDKLTAKLKAQGLPCSYMLNGAVLILYSTSIQMVNQACQEIKGAVSEFILNVEPEYEYIIYSEDWKTFLMRQGTCNAETSAQGNTVSVVTLKEAELEVKENIARFLSTPIQREKVLSMQPAMLIYIQLHHQQLLMDMSEVIIFPLDSGDGLSIQGNPTAVQTAAEVLSSVIDSTYTKIITVNQPGIARFLRQDEEGLSILGEMTAKFQVYINLERVHWEPLEEQDIFALAWKMMSSQNFARSSSVQHVEDPRAGAPPSAAADKDTSARLEEAKKILCLLESDRSHMAAAAEEEEMDLYSAPASSGEQMETQDSLKAESQQEDMVSLDEDASLSLAIQMSMEDSQNPELLAEEELQKVLQLSKDEATSMDEGREVVKVVDVSFKESISSANVAQIEVFACYTHDLVRVDIALGKKVGLRQCEEKLQHTSFRKLSGFHRRCLDLIKRKHGVEIQVQGTTAVVTGFKNYVTEALQDLNELLERASGSTTDAEILKTVQWAWHDRERSVVTPYSPEATVFIENAWRIKQNKLDILFNNQPYTIDFTKMQEFSVSSGRSVPISRKLISSADLYTEFQDDYSLLSDIPDATRLEKESEEYKEVAAEFFSSLTDKSNVQIIQVEKLTNRLLYSQYLLKKADMEQKVRGDVERTLYHGTSESSVKEICIHGFNRSFCGKNATAFGQGVYFAVKSSYSISDTYSPHNADGHKFIFVARVLTGEFTQGKHDMRTAPLREGSDIPMRFHSVVDVVRDPNVFVIFNDTQAYPQYLITCTKTPE
ncbi:hypothetical protein KOW79_019698 [Hemibagrus wyckioides]|uniref:Poly [ADP-ribose] polymerase n=2 Tax=Hemibagrus wyckioides TaxID=337641 RepID=A0A9D3NAA0_9TELE|nr:protein mono-ADP-ribosyltransferase PARP10 isoform X2 [Hemibagrus wyckioides]XP_058233164.1 protein mono-ADP-ribosyltransferase PARP10 isoform X2 [Hemibagrus wyckioides]KAG7317400.1 hypothetical protein KOW79_019698 [Hemibagrus wyckioides]